MTYEPLQVVTRDRWGALQPNRNHLTPIDAADKRKYGGTIHHTTGATLGASSFITWVRNIQTYHMGTLGYGDIAYGTLIAPDGSVFIGRDENSFVGAHAASAANMANRHTRGIAFLGDLTHAYPTPAAQRAAFWCFDLMAYAGDELLAWAHQDWLHYGPPALPTACPGTPAGLAWVVGALRSWIGHGRP